MRYFLLSLAIGSCGSCSGASVNSGLERERVEGESVEGESVEGESVEGESANESPGGAQLTLTEVRYAVSFSGDLNRAHVDASGFQYGAGPLEPGRWAEFWVQSESGSEMVEGQLVDAGGFFRYDVRLTPEMGRMSFMRRGNEVIFDPRALIWRPESVDGYRLMLTIESPPNLNLSVPWHTEQVPGWVNFSGTIALVEHPPFSFNVDGMTVEVARFQGELQVDDEGIERWIRTIVRAVMPMGGQFPREHLQVLIVPVAESSDPIAFGVAKRGGGSSITLMASSSATEAELTRSWVGVHELTHLSMPRLSSGTWVSEGYATYLQEHLRMISGLQTPEQGWARFAHHFQSAREGSGQPLEEESAQMLAVHSRESFAHVYWAGAAYFLRLDVALHQRGTSLTALMHDSQWNRMLRWNHRQFLGELDRLLGDTVCLPLAETTGEQRAIEDMSDLLQQLGVVVANDETVTFDNDAPLAEIRRAIEGR